MEKYNPTDYLIKIQKIKYSEAIIPILLVFFSFAINFIKPDSFVKYLSLLGLLGFFFISFKYRIRKNIPPQEPDVVLSPVYGIINDLDISTNTFKIRKGIFTPADYRYPGETEKVEFKLTKGNRTLFETTSHLAGKLIGILPLAAEISCKLPEELEIKVKAGQKVIAGETILAVRK